MTLCTHEHSAAGEPHRHRLLTDGEYLGRVPAARTGCGYSLSIVTHARSGDLPSHAHDRAFICRLLTGGYVSRTRDSEMEFSPGEAAFHPEWFEHSDAILSPKAAFFGIQLDLERIADGPVTRGMSALSALPSLDQRHAIDRLACAFLASDDELVIDSLLYETVAAAFPDRARATDSPGWVPGVADRLTEESHSVLSLVELAAEAGVHATTLTRHFRNAMGCSIGEFRQRVRAHKALCRLLDGRDAISSICLDEGYSDQAHLTREFGKLFGLPPGRFRDIAARHDIANRH
ncbi:helix-turn-helix transcriptional regulator [Hyphobacterium marinum]|uniref:AraC family transcriptional regulator n=1 Tax=Hyphobacterium marinum TaxID=3116574 RepID=A0ABU7LYM5_9PROT|nr:AraC family transcriptional regulator [Hyphobacterium sp. Y6023]MEE2566653.1 AraC family transcriptional regulator [Hyphobacterium sp. Y6023]